MIDDAQNTNNDSSIHNNKTNDNKDMIYKILNGILVGLLSSNSSCAGMGVTRSIVTIKFIIHACTFIWKGNRRTWCSNIT